MRIQPIANTPIHDAEGNTTDASLPCEEKDNVSAPSAIISCSDSSNNSGSTSDSGADALPQAPRRYRIFVVKRKKNPHYNAMIEQVRALALACFGDHEGVNRAEAKNVRLIVAVEEEEETCATASKSTEQCPRIFAFVLCELFREWECVQVAKLFVAREWRKQGIGRRLMKQARSFAKQNRVYVIGLWAYFSAVAFYRRLGFRPMSKKKQARYETLRQTEIATYMEWSFRKR